MEITNEIFQKAILIFHSNKEKLPEDDWISLSEDWDLNIYTNEFGHVIGNIYLVKDGNTKVDKSYFRFIEDWRENW